VRQFRIFLASPGDVTQERALAGEVFEQLRHELRFRDELNLQKVAWDQPGQAIALPMGMTPQQAISQGLMQPCECDLVLILLWSRMGTPLPAEYVKPDGSPYLSGTEWEYWNAMQAFRVHGKPRIWMYHRSTEPMVHLGDPHLSEKREQWQRLQSFLGMIRNPDGSIAHGLNSYLDAADFRRQLESHLRHELERFLREAVAPPVTALTNPTTPPHAAPAAPSSSIPAPQHAAATPVVPSSLSPLASAFAMGVTRTKPKYYMPQADAPLPFSDLGEVGKDDYGDWLRWQYQGVAQTFRWIKPGRFLMGSPKSEPERYDNETQHEVHLTRGFWLADTAVTQSLWTAVMGNNPSSFQGKQRPVENVSWDETQEFLRQLRRENPDAPFALPAEAEWEYACRAGTRTPFSFGLNITPEQVNYKGKYPYSGAKKGLYRKKTVAVKSLPPNAWGLYEMHGNVWEWCDDRLRDFGAVSAGEIVVDPVGSTESASRAARGGSWIDGAGSARSACRSTAALGIRIHFLGYHLGPFGFRLALRSTSPVRPEGA
jgi:formylglycine-generating enzyme required for sulfatase activity